jgi:hypothetical protein
VDGLAEALVMGLLFETFGCTCGGSQADATAKVEASFWSSQTTNLTPQFGDGFTD